MEQMDGITRALARDFGQEEWVPDTKPLGHYFNYMLLRLLPWLVTRACSVSSRNGNKMTDKVPQSGPNRRLVGWRAGKRLSSYRCHTLNDKSLRDDKQDRSETL